MESNTRRNFFGKMAGTVALFSSAPKLFAQQAAAATAPAPEESRRDVPVVATRSMGFTTFPARAPMTVTARKIMSWLPTHLKNTSRVLWMPLRGRLNVLVPIWTASFISMFFFACLLRKAFPRPQAKHDSMHTKRSTTR